MGVKKEWFCRIHLKSLLIAPLLLLSLFSALAGAEILIISNKSVPDTSLTDDYVRDIFLGKRGHWSDNSTIHVFVVKEQDIHEKFLEQYVHKSVNQWRTYWKRMVFTGRGLPPKSINTEAELIDQISKTEGAIGYVSSDGLPDHADDNSVRILKIGR